VIERDPAGEPGEGERVERAPGDGPGDAAGPGQPVSGLKNPAAAVRGAAVGALVLECVVVLLAIQPIRILAPDTPGWALAVVAGLALACLAVAGLLRYPWGWHVGTALQVAVVLTGFLQYAMFVLGLVFLAVWIYILRIRSDVTKPPH
jgi:hypothetical protein